VSGRLRAVPGPPREVTVPFYRRGTRYPWAVANIRRAEAAWGPPSPSCYCGAPLSEREIRAAQERCETCRGTP
jgi:hypothetical protein